jgi:hypothetical protein
MQITGIQYNEAKKKPTCVSSIPINPNLFAYPQVFIVILGKHG